MECLVFVGAKWPLKYLVCMGWGVTETTYGHKNQEHQPEHEMVLHLLEITSSERHNCSDFLGQNLLQYNPSKTVPQKKIKRFGGSVDSIHSHTPWDKFV